MTELILFPAPQLGDAASIIKRLEKLLSDRRQLLINRRTFLRRYSLLRAELEMTPEYALTRMLTFQRAAGVCEKCHLALATQLCHKKQVSRFPQLALASDNLYAGCPDCNQEDTPQFKVRGASR